jgi:caffeoyl-CoA O-methyltransferase
MNIVHPNIDAYLLSYAQSPDSVFEEMEKLAEQINFPIVGPVVGRLLYQYARLLNPKRILELGSGYGYSALWWATGAPSAQIICTEGADENIKRARTYLSQAGVWDKVQYHQGDALKTIDHLQGEFDVIFMDIDKVQYPDGFVKGFPRLRTGGLFITDNVLWSGKVADPNPDENTRAILHYNELIYSIPGAFSTIIPVRDGVAVTYKES